MPSSTLQPFNISNPGRRMHFLDLTLPTPAENLALDEALLDQAETKGGSGVLLFWESPQPFVVLGYANQVAQEVHLEACRERNTPILRRCSGGGTVLQGPGCLNYSVILNFNESPALQTISGTNQFVMERQRDALSRLLHQEVTIEGHTDLALAGLKFSGNAQRRKREWLLFHGTLLLPAFVFALISECLRPPPLQPAYRRRRSHEEFLTRLPMESAVIKTALREAWQAATPLAEIPQDRIARLVSERYGRAEWNLKR